MDKKGLNVVIDNPVKNTFFFSFHLNMNILENSNAYCCLQNKIKRNLPSCFDTHLTMFDFTIDSVVTLPESSLHVL